MTVYKIKVSIFMETVMGMTVTAHLILNFSLTKWAGIIWMREHKNNTFGFLFLENNLQVTYQSIICPNQCHLGEFPIALYLKVKFWLGSTKSSVPFIVLVRRFCFYIIWKLIQRVKQNKKLTKHGPQFLLDYSCSKHASMLGHNSFEKWDP